MCGLAITATMAEYIDFYVKQAFYIKQESKGRDIQGHLVMSINDIIFPAHCQKQ